MNDSTTTASTKIVTLIGKTQHGKNRLREQGASWIVVDEKEFIACRPGVRGPWFLLRIANDKTVWGGLRWVHGTEDKDFTMEVN